MEEEKWSFYIIQNKGATYAGVSPDPIKRLKKHNGEMAGGAIYTKKRGPGWRHICIISGFNSKIESMQFEWAVKHAGNRRSCGIINRLKKLLIVLHREHWTSKSPFNDTPLHIKWIEEVDFGKYELPEHVTEDFYECESLEHVEEEEKEETVESE
jgi:predicted GIY-YIG superfamily endonuclease